MSDYARNALVPQPGVGKPGVGMVHGIKAGGLIFLSAIRGASPDGTYSDDTAEQARCAFETARKRLAGGGATLDHVVKVTLYLTELKYRAAFHKVWMEVFGETPPARIAMKVGDANSREDQNAHFALDIIAVAP
jgi:2-iminobutanoate/2-iminopropanoate deaminase